MFIQLILVCSCATIKAIDNKCKDTDSSKIVCCSDYEEINGICVECKPGYTSSNGYPCKPCRKGYYGVTCQSLCQCSDGCHYLYGCTELPREATTEPIRIRHTSTVDITVTIYKIEETTTEVYKDTTMSTDKKEETTTEEYKDTTDITMSKDKKEVFLLLGREMLPIILGILILLCVMGVAVCLLRTRIKNRSLSLNTNTEPRPTNNSGNRIEDAEDDGEESEIYEGHYHFIDETLMVDFHKQDNPYLDVIDDSSTSGSAIEETSEYLNPYTPVVNDTECHYYTGGICDETSEYLNPYTPIVKDTEIHYYKSGVSREDICCYVNRLKARNNVYLSLKTLDDIGTTLTTEMCKRNTI